MTIGLVRTGALSSVDTDIVPHWHTTKCCTATALGPFQRLCRTTSRLRSLACVLDARKKREGTKKTTDPKLVWPRRPDVGRENFRKPSEGWKNCSKPRNDPYSGELHPELSKETARCAKTMGSNHANTNLATVPAIWSSVFVSERE